MYQLILGGDSRLGSRQKSYSAFLLLFLFSSALQLCAPGQPAYAAQQEGGEQSLGPPQSPKSEASPQDHPQVQSEVQSEVQPQLQSQPRSERTIALDDALIGQTYNDQYFELVEHAKAEQGLLSKLRRWLPSAKTSVAKINYNDRAAFLNYRAELGARAVEDLELQTFYGADGQVKFKFSLTHSLSALGKYIKSSAVFDSPLYDIVAHSVGENRVFLASSNGLIFMLDRNAIRRTFGLSRPRPYIVGRSAEIAAALARGSRLEFVLVEGPFSLRTNVGPFEGSFVRSGVVLFEVGVDGNRREIVRLNPKDCLKRAIAQEGLLLASRAAESSELATAAGALQAQIDAEAYQHFEQLRQEAGAAKAQLERESGDLFGVAMRSLQAQLRDIQEEKEFDLHLSHLRMSEPTVALVKSLLLEEPLETTIDTLAHAYEAPFAAAIDLFAHEMLHSSKQEPEPLKELANQLTSIQSASEKVTLFGESLVALIQTKNFSFQNWLEDHSDVLPLATHGLLQLVLAAHAHESWSFADQVVLAGLFEWRRALDEYLKSNLLDPQRNKLQGLRDSLERLEMVGSHPQLTATMETLRTKLSTMETPDWISLIGEAELADQDAFDDWLKAHHKPLSLSERLKETVRQSSFYKTAKKVGAQIVAFPNLFPLLSLGALEYYARTAGDLYPEGTHRLAQMGVIGFWSIYSAFRVGYWAWGKRLGEPDGSMRMAVAGARVFISALSKPPMVRWWEWRGHHNAVAAAQNGLWPSAENGGFTRAGESLETAGQRLQDIIDDRSRLAALCRDIAFTTAVENALPNASLPSPSQEAPASYNFFAVYSLWHKDRLKKIESRKAQWEALYREALLSAEPEKIRDTEALITQEKFIFELNLKNSDDLFLKKYEILFETLHRDVLASGARSQDLQDSASQSLLRLRARSMANDLERSSRFTLGARHMLAQWRSALRQPSRTLLFMFKEHFAQSREQMRPDVASQNQVGAFTDFGFMALSHPVINWGPVNSHLNEIDWVRENHIMVPSRNDPAMPGQLFGQADGFMGVMHPKEVVTLANQLAIYKFLQPVTSLSEFGSVQAPPNRYRTDRPQDIERNTSPFFTSLSAIAKRMFQWKEFGGTFLWKKRFQNTFRFMYATSVLFMGPALAFGYDSSVGLGSNLFQAASQFLFSSGWGMLAYGLIWLPVRGAPASITARAGPIFKQFTQLRTYFSTTLEEGNDSDARHTLARIVELYRQTGIEFEPLENWKTLSVLDLTHEELVRIDQALYQVAPPAYAALHKGALQLSALTGAVVSTLFATPFIVLALNFPDDLKNWQALIGMAGYLTQFTIIKSLEALDNYRIRHHDPQNKFDKTAQALAPFARGDGYLLDMSARLSQQVAADLKKIKRLPFDQQEAAKTRLLDEFKASVERVVAQAQQLNPQTQNASAHPIGAIPSLSADYRVSLHSSCERFVAELSK